MQPPPGTAHSATFADQRIQANPNLTASMRFIRMLLYESQGSTYLHVAVARESRLYTLAYIAHQKHKRFWSVLSAAAEFPH